MNRRISSLLLVYIWGCLFDGKQQSLVYLVQALRGHEAPHHGLAIVDLERPARFVDLDALHVLPLPDPESSGSNGRRRRADLQDALQLRLNPRPD